MNQSILIKIFLCLYFILIKVIYNIIYSSFIFIGLAGFEKSAWSAPSLHGPGPRCLINDTATRQSLLVHREAALHGALGEQLWACAAPSPRTSPRAGWRQPSRPRRRRPTTRPRSAAASSRPTCRVEAVVELAHDLDQTGMHCVCLRRNGSLGSC